MLLASRSLASRELVRFLRQRSRVVSALATPLVFWFLIGSGLGGSFQPPGAPAGVGSLEFLFPGTLLLIVLFTAVFSTISIIEDRREGFLQSVLVAPVSRAEIVLGKLMGGTVLAVLQVMLVLVLAPFLGLRPGPEALLATAGTLVVIAFGLTGLGFWIAWRMDSTQGFHAIMNLFLIPLWLLSGALFPHAGAPTWLRVLMHANPLTYGLAALRRTLYLGSSRGEVTSPELPGLGLALGVSILFAVLMFVAALVQARRTSTGGTP